MRLFYRISALAVLLSPALVATSWPSLGGKTQPFPLRAPVTPELLRQRGSLRFAIKRDSLTRFTQAADSAEFDYDLLRQFATDLRLTLVERDVASDDEAAQLLRIGMVDAAVLPVGYAGTYEMLPARPCPSWIPAGSEPLHRPRLYAWPDSPELVGLLNSAAVRLSAARQDADIYAMYCEQAPPQRWARALLPRSEQISRYAGVIAKYADAAGLDWRLVAALIFEESTFEEQAVSASGALGLMQLMPWIPVEVGISNISRPESNIRAGILYLQRLAEQFPQARASDRLALVLASYLLGPAHVFDAQDLAHDRGLNPQAWREGIERTLPLLEDSASGKRAGIAHGRQAVEYVNRILERYETYRRHLDRDPELHASTGHGRRWSDS